MFSGFFDRKSNSEGAFWPSAKIVDYLKSQYENCQLLNDDGELQVYGVTDRGINFVVVLVNDAPGSGRVIEFGFVAKFSDVDITQDRLEALNANLHISIARREGADLFLLSALQVSGQYNDQFFAHVLEGWRRDLSVLLFALSGGDVALADIYPAMGVKKAVDFATNALTPTESGTPTQSMLSTFLGGKVSMSTCRECSGRGKRGLVARICEACGGEGFLKK